LDSIAASIIEHVVALEERAKVKKKAAMGELRRAQCERTRLLAPWRSAGIAPEARVPFPLMRYMLDNGMLVTGHGDKTGVRMVTCHDGVSPLIDTRPWLLAFNVDGPGKDIAQLRHAIGEKKN
jgi:hypothetical protein